MDISNASLLDEGGAAAEASLMSYFLHHSRRKKYVVSPDMFPNTIDMIINRATGYDLEIVVTDPLTYDYSKNDVCGVLVQSPDRYGHVRDWSDLAERVH